MPAIDFAVETATSSFGRLIVLEQIERSRGRQPRVRCRCQCGTVVDVRWDHLRSGATRSCGCLASELMSARNRTSPRVCRVDLIGRRFGRLIVLNRIPTVTPRAHHAWWCRCDCGSEKQVDGYSLTRGAIVSCGCASRERAATLARTYLLRHGHARAGRQDKAYRAWCSLRKRCDDPNNARYGGRGIRYADSWRHFENFLRDMGEPPSPRHSIDRIDNDGDYTPENCRWATAVQQANNRRNTTIVEIAGVRRTAGAWAASLGIRVNTLHSRVQHWSAQPSCQVFRR